MGHTDKKCITKTKRYDFVIIGSGIAGLMSALYAAKKGTVLILTKSELKKSNTWYAQGGVAAAISSDDNFKKHITDTLKAGHYLNDQKTVEYIIKKAPTAIKELERFGVTFEREQANRYNLKLEGGHSKNRVLYHKDKIGQNIENNLIKEIKKNPDITVKTNCFALNLVMNQTEKKCIGVQYISNSKTQKKINKNTTYRYTDQETKKNYIGTANPKILSIYCRRIILATGGAGQIFSKTTNPAIATGDGIAMAHRTGAKIKGMEFVQFHPTALVNSTSTLKNNPDKVALNKNTPLFLLSETLRGEGAVLLNYKKERFMIKIHPLAELAPRDVISKAIFDQQKKGPVFIDLRAIPKKRLKNKYPTILNKLKKENIPYNKPIKITPAAHYLCGGIVTDIFGRTSIQNLYATGECANTGLHGANRLASNSLLEAAIMSKQVIKKPLPKNIGKPKTQLSNRNNNSLFKINRTDKQFNIPSTTQKIHTSELHEEISKIVYYKEKIQTIMMKKCGIIRKREDMKLAKKQIQKILSELNSFKNDLQIADLFETINLAETAMLILTMALKHTKTSGAPHNDLS